MGWVIFVVLIFYLIAKSGKKKSKSAAKVRPYNPEIKFTVNYGASDQRTTSKIKTVSEWHARGKNVNIKGYTIDGLIYTGKAGNDNENYRGSGNHIIDPSLKVIDAGDSNLGDLGYWPSYANITPQHRARYLQFLMDRAQDSNIETGYVFLYFYGLETRLIKDEAIYEYDDIVSEVQRLKEIFLGNTSANRSFDMYSKALLSAAYILKHKDTGAIDYNDPECEDSTIINICISEYAQRDNDIPPELILKGIRASHYCSRKSYTRAKYEFDKLFIKSFKEKYPKGFKITNRKRKFIPEYVACSGNFRKAIYRELPLVVTDSFYNQFKKIIDTCCDRLDEYSRHLGKSDMGNTLYSKVILPAELAKDNGDVIEYINATKDNLTDGQVSVINYQEFAIKFKNENKLSKKEYENIALFHNDLGFGLLPSPNYGDSAPRLNDNIIIFQLPGKRSLKISSEFIEVKNIVHLAVAVANADSIDAGELKIIHDLIDSYKNLNIDERTILKNRIIFLARNPAYLKDIRSKLGAINEGQKRSLIDLLISIVVSDGKISNEETKVLKLVYTAFGYDEKQMYNDLHEYQSGHKGEVVLVSVGKKENTYKIPKKAEPKDVALDMNLVNRKKAETKKVAEVLSDIFKETEQEAPVTSKDQRGMDANLGQFFAVLLTQTEWRREDLESHAKKNMLFLGSALEKINDWSLENYEETIVDEDGDKLIVNKDLVA